jgi:hypothetical protein
VAADQPPDQVEDSAGRSVQDGDGLTSSVIGLLGAMVAGVHRTATGHAFGPHAAVPYLLSAVPAGPGDIYGAAVSLSADPAGHAEPPALTVSSGEAGRLTVTTHWTNGHQDQLVL